MLEKYLQDSLQISFKIPNKPAAVCNRKEQKMGKGPGIASKPVMFEVSRDTIAFSGLRRNIFNITFLTH